MCSQVVREDTSTQTTRPLLTLKKLAVEYSDPFQPKGAVFFKVRCTSGYGHGTGTIFQVTQIIVVFLMALPNTCFLDWFLHIQILTLDPLMFTDKLRIADHAQCK